MRFVPSLIDVFVSPPAALLSFQRDDEENLKLKGRLSADALQTSTEAPRHTTAHLSNKSTPEPKVKSDGRSGPHVVQTSKNDGIIVSE